MHGKPALLCITLLLFLAGPLLAASSATLLKDETLRSKPFLNAPVSARLKRGSSVSLLTRQGAWSQVKTPTHSGWMRSLSLKSGASIRGGTLATQNSGRLGSGKIVSTTGIRGLDSDSEPDLKSAEFSAEALAAAHSHAVTAKDARRFAASGQLKAKKLAWLAKGQP